MSSNVRWIPAMVARLVGEDRLLRSRSRFLIENPDKFVTQAEANGLPAATANQIRARHHHTLHARGI